MQSMAYLFEIQRQLMAQRNRLTVFCVITLALICGVYFFKDRQEGADFIQADKQKTEDIILLQQTVQQMQQDFKNKEDELNQEIARLSMIISNDASVKNDEIKLNQHEERLAEGKSPYPNIYVFDNDSSVPDPRKPLFKQNDIYIEEHFHRYYMNSAQAHCGATYRLGAIGDGGWDICIAEPYKPRKGKCIVYSFGIGFDFGFDDGISGTFGCNVYAFDPSMDVADHQRGKFIQFYNLGLSGEDKQETRNDGAIWNMMTLKSILKKLNHESSIIDVLKMDIESTEWKALPDMIATGVLVNVKQLAVEYHAYYENTHDLTEFVRTLDQLYLLGFRHYQTHINPFNCVYESPSYHVKWKTRVKCFEVYYININFLK